MLKKYVPDPSLTQETLLMELQEDLSFKVRSMKILDRKERRICPKVIQIVKVRWRCDFVEEMTWEPEVELKQSHSHLFQE